MKKCLFAALLALVFAVPGMAKASPVHDQVMCMSPEMDPELVEAILRAAAEQQYEYDYVTLQQMYDDGELAINQEPGVYHVNLPGGGAISVLEEVL